MVSRKKILIYPLREKRHTIYDSTIDLLTKHYGVIYLGEKQKSDGIISRLSRNALLRYIYLKLVRPHISLRELGAILKKKESVNEKYDMILSSNLIPNIPGKYIIDLESIIALKGYDYARINKKEIESKLGSDQCKAILCWNDISKSSMIATLNCRKFNSKIKVLPFAMQTDTIKKNFDSKKVNFLFVSSVNNIFDFERKGGIIALEAYSELRKKHNNISFLIRATVPAWIKKKYQSVPGVLFIEKFLSAQQMKDLFMRSDILLEPIPGINLMLECMNFSIPIIGSDFWATPEMVINNKSGFIIDFSSIFGNRDDIENYTKNLEINYLKMHRKKPNKHIIDMFLRCSEKLIGDPALRKEMGLYAKKLLGPKGRYSLQKRNNSILAVVKSSLSS